MGSAIFGLIGVLIGSGISIYIISIEIFYREKQRFIEREMKAYKEAFAAASEYLYILSKIGYIPDKEKAYDFSRELKEAELDYFQSVNFLKLLGNDVLAKEIEDWISDVKNLEYKIKEEKNWLEALRRLDKIIQDAKHKITLLESKNYRQYMINLILKRKTLWEFLKIECRK